MTTYVTSRCHCGRNEYKVAFRTASLPMASELCHCNTCRHSTGQMAYHRVRIQGVPLENDDSNDKPADLKNLTQYKATDRETRYFCGTCSAHMFLEAIGDDAHFSVAVGTLDTVEGIFKPTAHLFLRDTLDGGLANHYRTAMGSPIARFAGNKGSETLPIGWRAAELEASNTEESKTRLSLYCNCGANTFHVIREKRQPPRYKWWIISGGPGRSINYLILHCACNSCRLTSGQEIQTWMFVPRVNIVDPATSRPVEFMDPSKRPKGLKQYASTPEQEIYREFCGTCGASMFFWTTGRDFLDVSGGILDHNNSGARASQWGKWNYPEIGWAQYALNEDMLESLREGFLTHEILGWTE